MKIIVRNNAEIANKYVRFIKWKIRTINEKFKVNLLYAEVYITKEGQSHVEYKSTIKLGIPGNDIVLINKSVDLKALWSKSSKDIARYLKESKSRRIKMANKNLRLFA